jgi:uncharacterized surface protein with fasciclin (FAS1) repeats
MLTSILRSSAFVVAVALLLAAPLRAQETDTTVVPPDAGEAVPGGIILDTESEAPETGTLLDVAREQGNLSTFVSLVEAAGLSALLHGDGSLTVFAPTDEAFEQLPAGTLEDLYAEENAETLRSILTYHLVEGRVPSMEVSRLSSTNTLGGQALVVVTENDVVRVNEAGVIASDIDARNGMIHAIDRVLIPPDVDITGAETPDVGIPPADTPEDPWEPASPEHPTRDDPFEPGTPGDATPDDDHWEPDMSDEASPEGSWDADEGAPDEAWDSESLEEGTSDETWESDSPEEGTSDETWDSTDEE